MSPGLKFVKLTHTDFLKCEICMFNILKKREYNTDWRKYTHTQYFFQKLTFFRFKSNHIFCLSMRTSAEHRFVTMMLSTNSSQLFPTIRNQYFDDS